MKTTTYTTLIWTDPRLAFDQSDYDGIDRFHINSEEVSSNWIEGYFEKVLYQKN